MCCSCWNCGCCRDSCCGCGWCFGGSSSRQCGKGRQDAMTRGLRWHLHWLQWAFSWESNLSWPLPTCHWPLSGSYRPQWPLRRLLDKLDLIEAWILALQFVREHLGVLRWRISLKLALIPQHLKAQLTLLLHTLVLKELVEAAAAKLLPVLKQAEGAEVPGLPGVDRPPLHVPLAVAQRCPALHSLPGDKMISQVVAC